ncbi:histone deacetylase complex protein [Panaeolus papilionaceus]|nr:histone deacetylase complex protein [Panaeolus papilionaceus]
MSSSSNVTNQRKGRVVYICSQELSKISSLLPSNKQRSSVVHALVKAFGLMSPEFSSTKHLQVVTPRRATYKDLATYHTKDYLDATLNHTSQSDDEETLQTEFGLEDDCPYFPGLPEYMQLVGGATLTAVVALQRNLADVSICWDGGRHHARRSQASGFCYVADCVLAILALKRNIPSPSDPPTSPTQRKLQIMYLDLDLHFSDGVSEAFYAPSHSIHHTSPGFFPPSRLANLPDAEANNFDPYTLSIPLKEGASCSTYAKIWPIVARVRDTFEPDYIIVQCGVDALAGDPCATSNWCLGGAEGSLGWYLEKVIKEWPGKKLILGGGYNSPNAARAWAYLTSLALDNPLDLESNIPDHAGFPLYAPSFTLDVPQGNMVDRNSEEYLDAITKQYELIIPRLASLIASRP